ncbi:Mut7-C RNAse domain-containing protein [Pontibacter sp. SGAir0037]|uniref:Mut7-C RNAse domain-containing protein n=1 Tax=Pontibacter sp. SGAir0037 TaxID=2571030 RepID=UPI0010CD3F5B|nr:Mut7-C RNAse domain-containing protein [Pontibacter sp. SGAir0037]QCR22667.1 hypothetical protein C1N53_10145 [Pontibacter sp. SGAir0037]
MWQEATFFFHGSLNDFLSKKKKEAWVAYAFTGTPAVKDAIEAMGVPHPEIGKVLVNQVPVGLNYLLKKQDRVEVYPFSTPATVPGMPAFVLDVHLGTLAKNLRLLGFDTLYQNTYSDREIATIAEAENRIVLTRDVGLLKQKSVKCGYWLRSQHLQEQLEEVMQYYHLKNYLKPLTRCLACNGLLKEAAKEEVLAQLPPKTKIYFHEFYRCLDCHRVYWKGSHYERMEVYIRQLKENSDAKESGPAHKKHQ